MADNTFIAATTSAVSKKLTLANGQDVTISASGLAGAEVVDIQILQGTSYVNTGEQLTASAITTVLQGPGQFQLAKGSSVSASAVYVDG